MRLNPHRRLAIGCRLVHRLSSNLTPDLIVGIEIAVVIESVTGLGMIEEETSAILVVASVNQGTDVTTGGMTVGSNSATTNAGRTVQIVGKTSSLIAAVNLLRLNQRNRPRY